MQKSILAGSNFQVEKYFFDEQFSDLPTEVKKEVKVLCVSMSEQLHCVFIVGFYADGTLFFETSADESTEEFDEVKAQTAINNAQKEHKELIRTLQYWYIMFKTEDGLRVKEKLLKEFNEKKQ